jgi:hypothetical protein
MAMTTGLVEVDGVRVSALSALPGAVDEIRAPFAMHATGAGEHPQTADLLRVQRGTTAMRPVKCVVQPPIRAPRMVQGPDR